MDPGACADNPAFRELLGVNSPPGFFSCDIGDSRVFSFVFSILIGPGVFDAGILGGFSVLGPLGS